MTTRDSRIDSPDDAITEIIPFIEYGDHLDEVGFHYNTAFSAEAAVVHAPEVDDLHEVDDLTPLRLAVPSKLHAVPDTERYDNPYLYPRRGRLLDIGYFWSFLRAIRAWQWALASSGWITLLCMEYLPSGSPARVLLVFGFVLFCPGFAVAGLLPTRESAERWVLAIALSMSFGLLVSVAFTLMRDDSVMLRIGSLALITTIAVLVDAVVSPRGRISFAQADEKVQR